MKIFSYYENTPGRCLASELRLLWKWREAWARHGFTPTVLNEYHSRKHPAYAEVAEKKPENRSWVRMLAMAHALGNSFGIYCEPEILCTGADSKGWLSRKKMLTSYHPDGGLLSGYGVNFLDEARRWAGEEILKPLVIATVQDWGANTLEAPFVNYAGTLEVLVPEVVTWPSPVEVPVPPMSMGGLPMGPFKFKR